MTKFCEITERLYRTEDGRVVPEGDPDARWLYAVPGQRVPLEEAVELGIEPGASRETDQDNPEADSEQPDGPPQVDPEEKPAAEGAETPEAEPPSTSENSPKRRRRKKS